MGMKKSSTFLFIFIILFSVLESEELDNTTKELCEKEEISGTYHDSCDCGSLNKIVLKTDGSIEIIYYSEVTDCHTHLEWVKKGNYIETVEHPYINVQKFKIEKEFPVNQKILKTIGGGIDKESNDIYQRNKSVEHILIYEVNDSEDILFEKKETYFFKTYSIEDFKILKCAKNKNSFLKRMIYYIKFFFEKEEKVVEFINKTAKEKNDFNAKDIDGVTALHAAVDCEFVKTVELLLKKGAVPNIKNAQGITPLSLARQNGLKEIEELLKKYGAKE